MPNERMCTDPERVKNHALGTDGSCHTCAMALDSDFNLIEADEELDDADDRDYRNQEHYDRRSGADYGL